MFESRSLVRVCAEIRKVNPGCIVLILTGYPAMETAEAAIQLGVEDYIAKPANADYLWHFWGKGYMAERCLAHNSSKHDREENAYRFVPVKTI